MYIVIALKNIFIFGRKYKFYRNSASLSKICFGQSSVIIPELALNGGMEIYIMNFIVTYT